MTSTLQALTYNEMVGIGTDESRTKIYICKPDLCLVNQLNLLSDHQKCEDCLVAEGDRPHLDCILVVDSGVMV